MSVEYCTREYDNISHVSTTTTYSRNTVRTTGRNAFPQGKKKIVQKKQSKTRLVGRGNSKCVNLVTNIK
jgi:hypothetical protein